MNLGYLQGQTKRQTMLTIVADHKIPFLEGALEPFARVKYLPGKDITTKHLEQADALITRTRTRCDEKLLKGTPVRFIASATIGYDHIDTQYCEAHDIRWTNAPGCNSGSVAQYISSALAIISVKHTKPLHELSLGIIGAGNVGSKVVRLADLLGMRLLVSDPPRQQNEGPEGFSDLDTLLKESDIVTLHVPLEQTRSNNTFHLANAGFFRKMKKGAWFINTSRGEVTHTQALLEALKSKHLAGAVLDVWENEPQINLELLQHCAIATPHIAGYSADGKANGTAMSVQAISNFFGLGIDLWWPENIPTPPFANTNFNCLGKKRQDIFRELSLLTYNILQDSQLLKSSPQTFEQQREEYPLRREPAAYTLKLFECKEQNRKFIEDLGFNILH